jgi:hypothetical protein
MFIAAGAGRRWKRRRSWRGDRFALQASQPLGDLLGSVIETPQRRMAIRRCVADSENGVLHQVQSPHRKEFDAFLFISAHDNFPVEEKFQNA